MMAEMKPRFQFRLRTLFVVMTLAAVVCWYVAGQWRIVQARSDFSHNNRVIVALSKTSPSGAVSRIAPSSVSRGKQLLRTRSIREFSTEPVIVIYADGTGPHIAGRPSHDVPLVRRLLGEKAVVVVAIKDGASDDEAGAARRLFDEAEFMDLRQPVP